MEESLEEAERRAEVVRDAEDRLNEIGLGAEVSVQGLNGVLTFKRNKKRGWFLLYGPEGSQDMLTELSQKEQEEGIALIPLLEATLLSEAKKKAGEINEIVDKAQEVIRRERESWVKR